MVSNLEQLDKRINEPLAARESKSSGGGGNPDSPKTDRKETRGRPRKSAAAAAAAAEKTIVPRMVDVEIPTPESLDPTPTPPKKARPKKPSGAAAAKKIGVTSENVATLIQTCGDIVGNREGFEIWKLDEKECKQLADPLSKIIGRSEYLERITNEYGDVIALTIAASTVLIPRVMIQANMNKEKKLNEIEKQKEKNKHARESRELRNEGNENRTIGSSHRGFNEAATHGDQIISPEFHKSIPIIQG